MDVPEGQMKIAQRFNAGMYATPGKAPKGRLKDGKDRFTFSRPFGTRVQSTTIPALKRRAIIGMSLRDKFSLKFRMALGLGRFHRKSPDLISEEELRRSPRSNVLSIAAGSPVRTVVEIPSTSDGRPRN